MLSEREAESLFNHAQLLLIATVCDSATPVSQKELLQSPLCLPAEDKDSFE